MIKINDYIDCNVAKTLLIPLWCCATPCRANPRAEYDPNAVHLIRKLDYDFSAIQASFKEYGQLCCLAREMALDRRVREFCQAHPEGSIVNLGCGLSTLSERCPAGRCHWFDLDFPEVVKARQVLFEPRPGHFTIGRSLLDPSWMDEVGFDPAKGMLLVAAGVFHYLQPDEVRLAVVRMAERFPGAWLFFDAVSRAGMKVSNRYVGRAGNTGAVMHFCVERPSEIASWSPCIGSVVSLPFFKEIKAEGLTLASRFNMAVGKAFNMLKYIDIAFK